SCSRCSAWAKSRVRAASPALPGLQPLYRRNEMKKLAFLGAAAWLFAAAGCASMQQPSAEELGRLPVVQFGDPVPAGGEYILFFPADKPIPTNVAIKGNIFSREAEQ